MARQNKKEQIDGLLFKLYLSNELLADYEAGVRALFSECKSVSERELVRHIISRIKIISERQVSFALQSMAMKIEGYAGADETAVVAVSMSYDPDSSQAVAHLIKPFLRDSKNVKLFTTVPQFLRRITSYKKCILIDEFSGTGKTIVQRVAVVSKDALEKNHEIDVKVLLICAMERAIELMLTNGVVVQAEQQLQAGLSGHFAGKDLVDAISTMRILEERLASEFDGQPIPSLGYGGAEALYCVKNWNAPNSNFPILWWPDNFRGKRRKVIFKRSSP